MIKYYNLKILIYFNSPIIQHLTPKTPYLPHSFPELSNFAALEGGLQMFFGLQK
jgi:hypothetical protein